MTVKSILGECLLKMGLEDFTRNSKYTDSEQELINSLLGALNIAYREIVCEYLPQTVTEDVAFDDGQLFINKLAKQILYPIRVLRGSESVSFKAYPNRIVANINGGAKLEYAYIPSTALSIGSSINDLRITQAAISDGTLAEYYFANKVFDLAKSFDTSFRNKMCFLRYKGRDLRFRERRWQS